MHNNDLKLFDILETAAMIGEGGGRFHLVGKTPTWFAKLDRLADCKCLSISPEQLFPYLPDFMQKAESFWAAQGRGRLRSTVWCQALSDGDEVMLEASAVLYGQARLLLIEPVVENNDRRKSGRKPVANDDRFRSLFDNLFDAQVLVDAQGRIRDVNRAACRLVASTKETLCDRMIDDLFSAQGARCIGEALSIALREGLAYVDETMLKQGDGPDIPLEGGGVRLEIDGHHQVVFSFHDISSRKALQSQLQQTQKMEAIGTLASGIAHDFNNILSAIIGYAELVRMDLEGPSRIRRNLDQLLAAGDRAKSLVQQILAFSRQTDATVQTTKVRSVIMEALKLMRASLPSSVRIQPNLRSSSFVRCDPTQIHQICINLLTNAGQSMGEDGGVITVQLDDATLDETFSAIHPQAKPGGYVRLSVTDTGSGIPDAVIGKIFDPFFTTKPQGRGTGMGLSVVHGIVTALGGAIAVHNQTVGGCRFDVYLPVCMAKTESLPVVQEEVPTGAERVLFVDDEVFQADVGHQLLARLGYDVTASTDSIEALSMFEKDPLAFDLVVTDMIMPRLSGKRLAQRMHAIRPDMPMILCSGFSSSIDESDVGEMGFSAYLKKPLMIKEMADAIRQALDGTQADA